MTVDGENVIDIIKEELNVENIMVHDHTIKGPEGGKEKREWEYKMISLYPEKIHYEITPTWDAIMFTRQGYELMHKKLKIPNIKRALAGLGTCKRYHQDSQI